MHHELKIDKPYLQQKLAGDKLFEIRFNDRGYQKGDTVGYWQYQAGEEPIEHIFEIIYVTGYLQQQNYVVFGEKHVESIQGD